MLFKPAGIASGSCAQNLVGVLHALRRASHRAACVEKGYGYDRRSIHDSPHQRVQRRRATCTCSFAQVAGRRSISSVSSRSSFIVTRDACNVVHWGATRGRGRRGCTFETGSKISRRIERSRTHMRRTRIFERERREESVHALHTVAKEWPISRKHTPLQYVCTKIAIPMVMLCAASHYTRTHKPHVLHRHHVMPSSPGTWTI